MKNNPFCPSSGFAAFFFCCFFASYASNAQIITTIAGKGGTGYNGDGIAASAAQLYAPNTSFVDLR